MSSPSAPLSFTTDATAPTLRYLLINPETGLSTGGGVTVNTNAFYVGGNVSDSLPGTEIDILAQRSDQSAPALIATHTTTASYEDIRIPTPALPDGTYTFTVSATDVAGNVSTIISPSGLTIDTTAPATPAVTLPLSYASGHWTLAGSAEAGSTVTVTDGTRTWSTVGSGGAWTVATTDNNAAIRKFTVTAADAAGNASLPSGGYYEGTASADIFNFASEAGLSAATLINGGAGNDTILMTSSATLTDADFAHVESVELLGLNDASSVSLAANALAAGIATINIGAGNTSVIDVNTGKLTLNAAGLGAGATLTLADLTTDTVTNLTGNLSATGDSAVLTVTVTGGTALNIATGSAAASITDNASGGSVTLDAAAMAAANTLALKGSAPETVINLAGNIAAGSLTGALTVTTTGATQTVTTGSGPTSVSDGSSTLLTINANAMVTGSGAKLTLSGAGPATVTNLKVDLDASGSSGAPIAVTATGAAPQNIATGAGSMSITDSTAGGSVIVNAAALASGSTLTLKGSRPETVTNFSTGAVDASGLTAASTLQSHRQWGGAADPDHRPGRGQCRRQCHGSLHDQRRNRRADPNRRHQLDDGGHGRRQRHDRGQCSGEPHRRRRRDGGRPFTDSVRFGERDHQQSGRERGGKRARWKSDRHD